MAGRRPDHAGHLSWDGRRRRWRASIQLGGRRHNRLFTDEDSARSWLKVLIQEWQQSGIMSGRPGELTVGQWLKHWLTEMGTTAKRGSSGQPRSPKTIWEYEKKVNSYLLPTIGAVPLEKLTVDLIYEWRQTMVDHKLSPRTINTTQTILAASLNMAIEQRRLTWNPAKAIRHLSVGKVSPGIALPVDRWQEAVQKAIDDGAMIVLLAALLGLRRGEAAAVRWADVDFRSSVPSIVVGDSVQWVTGKGLIRTPGKNVWSRRRITLPRVMQEVLRQRYRTGEQYICGDSVRDPGRLEAKSWYPIRDYIMWPHARLHDLRHTLITLLEMQADLNETAIKQYIGHAPGGVAQRVYTHPAAGLLPNSTVVAERIDRLYEEAKAKAYKVKWE